MTTSDPCGPQPEKPARRSRPRVVDGSTLLVDSPTAASMLGISERVLWTLTDAGAIPCVRWTMPGGKRAMKRYRVEDLNRFVEARIEEARR